MSLHTHNFVQLMHQVRYQAATGVFNCCEMEQRMVKGIRSGGLEVRPRGGGREGRGGGGAGGGRVSRNQSQQCTAYLSVVVRQQEHTP